MTVTRHGAVPESAKSALASMLFEKMEADVFNTPV